MIRRNLRGLVAVAAIATLLAAPNASAQVTSAVTPFGSFGAQPALTFGGAGIPNDWVMTTAVDGVLLALTAHQRFANPALTNDGAGTFFAQPGTDLNPPSPANPYALWNVGFAITGASTAISYYGLWYDFNPAVGNFGDYGLQYLLPTQDSWNLGMDFLATAGAFTIPPSFGSFDPNAGGEYGFALVAFSAAGAELGRTSILVNSEVVPEPATMTLLATGLMGMAGAARRRKSRKQA